MIETTVSHSPRAAREAKATQPTSERKAGLQRDHQLHAGAPVREVRPHEGQDVGERRRAAHQRDRDVDPEGGAAPAKCCLTSTAAVAPSTRPSVSPSSPQGRISRRKMPSARALGWTDAACGHARKLNAHRRAAATASLTSSAPAVLLSGASGFVRHACTTRTAATPLTQRARRRRARAAAGTAPVLLLLSGATVRGTRGRLTNNQARAK